MCRRVNKDRSVSLNSHLFEAPVGLVGKKVELVFSEAEPLNVEVVFDGNSWGKLTVLDQQINSKVHRSDYEPKSKDDRDAKPEKSPVSQSGQLFESGSAK